VQTIKQVKANVDLGTLPLDKGRVVKDWHHIAPF